MSTSPSRSWLFVPGDRPERFDKAAASGADEVIIDLEDAVSLSGKFVAREATALWLETRQAWVRINALDTEFHADDVYAIATLPGLRGVVLPKTDSAQHVREVSSRLPDATRVVALVETAAGVADAIAIAAERAVQHLAFGAIDFLLDIDALESDESLTYSRGALVIAARTAGLRGPIDGVTVETGDLGVIRRDARRARGQGFAGKLCIHPAQIAPVHEAFAATPADLAWARRVLEAAAARPEGGSFAFRLSGEMVDRPVLERARRLLDLPAHARDPIREDT